MWLRQVGGDETMTSFLDGGHGQKVSSPKHGNLPSAFGDFLGGQTSKKERFRAGVRFHGPSRHTCSAV